jgi:predicted NAD/FAD-dependent oxidoreductase
MAELTPRGCIASGGAPGHSVCEREQPASAGRRSRLGDGRRGVLVGLRDDGDPRRGSREAVTPELRQLARRRWDVVVVGAGLAGLAAAHELSGAGVCVLERTADPGGRVRTRHRSGIDYELGAVLAYPAALAPPAPPPPPARVDPAPMAIQLGGRLGRGHCAAACLVALGFSDAPRACLAWASGAADVARDVRRVLDACFHVIHPAAASVSLPERRVDALRPFPVARREGGNATLVARLAAPLGEALVAGVEVTAIDDGRDEVRVGVRGRRDAVELRARVVICAVPAPVTRTLLRTVEGPARALLDAVAFAPGTVVVVAVDDAPDDAWSYLVTPDHASSAVIQHHVPERGARVLHTYYVGDAARRLAALPVETAVTETLATLQAVGATHADAGGLLLADVRHWPMVGPVIGEAAYGRRHPDDRQPSPHVVLAGDWTFGCSRTDLPYGMGAAILSGRAAGRRVRRLLEDAAATPVSRRA